MTGHKEEQEFFLPQQTGDVAKPKTGVLTNLWRLAATYGTAFLLAWAVSTILFTSIDGLVSFSSSSKLDAASCDDTYQGYHCRPDISRSWGKYSPYFSTPSGIEDALPEDCEITFAQILSRHGARDPTLKKTLKYSKTVIKIQVTAKNLTGKYAFLKKYRFNLGADQLNAFGKQQLHSSGVKFYERYHKLTKDHVPFVRTSGQQRVIDSADAWMEGYHATKVKDKAAKKDNDFPYFKVIIPEGPEFNNTLDHSTCLNLESGPMSMIAEDAKDAWINVFGFPILARLRRELPDSDIEMDDLHSLMSMCPFDTVHSHKGKVSPFCELFSQDEWQQYNHLESLDQFYSWGKGNPLGPSQGVGYANELIARLTNTPVQDHTCTNSTLDSDPITFPIDKKHKVFADFSHDNDLTAIFFALGLYNSTPMLSISQVDSIEFTQGWSAAWSVPFAARAYFEKMQCQSRGAEELVRIIVNDRVIPLTSCPADPLGRCTLTDFIDSLSFVRDGGNWEQCYQSVGNADESLMRLPSGKMLDTRGWGWR